MQFVVWLTLDLKPIARIEADSLQEAYQRLDAKTMKEDERTLHYIHKPDGKPDEIIPIVVLPQKQSEALEVLFRGPHGDDALRNQILTLPPAGRFDILENGEEFLGIFFGK